MDIKFQIFFFTLPQYQNNEKYNQFYFTSHHKKEQLKSDNLKILLKQLNHAFLNLGQVKIFGKSLLE